MKKLVFSAMMLGGMLMASCVDSIYDAPQSETVRKTYAQKFQEMIGGPVSRTQDFSVPKLNSLKVNLAAPGDVKIYSRVATNVVYKLVANYEGLSAGSHELTFDAPEDVHNFAVEVGNVVKETTGEEVSFENVAVAASRTYVGEQAGKTGVTDVYSLFDTETNERVSATFAIEDVRSFDQILPAGWYSDGTTSIGRVLNGTKTDVHIDFKVVNTNQKRIKVYPIYWVASYRHEFGIYTYNEYGEIDQEYVIYRSRDNQDETDLQISFDNGNNWESANNGNKETNRSNIFAYWMQEKQYIYENLPVPTHVKSKGFEVTLPTEGQTYGFFINVYTNGQFDGQIDHKWYSDAKFNDDDNFHAAYFQTDVPNENGEGTRKRTFLGFEDVTLEDSGCDGDLNDFMFIIDPEPIIVDHTEQKWILAAEDLGDTDDFDFNDVVVSVSKVAGQTTMTVEALAAGGTLPVWLTFDNQVIKPAGVSGDGEFHSWFEGSNGIGEDGLYPMLNTGRSSKRAGKSVTLTGIDKTYSITQFSAPKKDGGFGGFEIKVQRKDGTFEYVTVPQHSEEDGIVGLAPQMMCLPYGWQWPLERVKMVEAYPQFGEWGTGYLNNTQWVNEYDETKIFK